MRLCGRCRAAENPLSKLRFTDSPEGVLCEGCYSRFYGGPEISAGRTISGPEQLVIITCPTCRGIKGCAACASCADFGVVRVQSNAIPVYNPPSQKGT